MAIFVFVHVPFINSHTNNTACVCMAKKSLGKQKFDVSPVACSHFEAGFLIPPAIKLKSLQQSAADDTRCADMSNMMLTHSICTVRRECLECFSMIYCELRATFYWCDMRTTPDNRHITLTFIIIILSFQIKMLEWRRRRRRWQRQRHEMHSSCHSPRNSDRFMHGSKKTGRQCNYLTCEHRHRRHRRRRHRCQWHWDWTLACIQKCA